MEPRREIHPDYVYLKIPAEYVCVYHKILAGLADFGEDMLKDCKASCTNRNKKIIDCFNMFNAAIAAKELGKDKLAETLIKYIKTEMNILYKGVTNEPGFVFPVDETGHLKAFVSCSGLPRFFINSKDMKLYKRPDGSGFDETYELDIHDNNIEFIDMVFPNTYPNTDMEIIIGTEVDDEGKFVGNIDIMYMGQKININDALVQYYWDDKAIVSLDELSQAEIEGYHELIVAASYEDHTVVSKKILNYIKPEE